MKSYLINWKQTNLKLTTLSKPLIPGHLKVNKKNFSV
jgi:hypothetical protein